MEGNQEDMKIVSMWGISGYQVYWGYKDRSSIVGLMIESVLGNAVIAVASTHCFKKSPSFQGPGYKHWLDWFTSSFFLMPVPYRIEDWQNPYILKAILNKCHMNS